MKTIFRRPALVAALCAAVWLAISLPAQAGANCEAVKLTARQMSAALELAARTSHWLDASGAQVVVLARAGQNLDQWGLKYSHLGFAYHDDDAKTWRVVHKLNQCGTDRAELYRQGLAEFYLDDLYRYEGAAVVLKPEIQKALLPLLKDNYQVAILHTRAYSMVAYPWAQKYQQSNQWALETLALAVEPSVTGRSRAQAWLQFKGYQPSVLNIGPFTRMGARVSRANVAFDDHPNEKRYAGRIETVTVDSVFNFLKASNLGTDAEVLR
jgi:hypothetical protein